MVERVKEDFFDYFVSTSKVTLFVVCIVKLLNMMSFYECIVLYIVAESLGLSVFSSRKNHAGLYLSSENLVIRRGIIARKSFLRFKFDSVDAVYRWDSVILENYKFLFFNSARFIDLKSGKEVFDFGWGQFDKKSMLELVHKYVPRSHQAYNLLIKKHS